MDKTSFKGGGCRVTPIWVISKRRYIAEDYRYKFRIMGVIELALSQNMPITNTRILVVTTFARKPHPLWVGRMPLYLLIDFTVSIGV